MVHFQPCQLLFQFSSSLIPSNHHSFVLHALSKVFMWFLCTVIVCLPATPLFLKHVIFSWRTYFWLDSVLAVIFSSLASPFQYFTLLWPVLATSFCTSAHYCPHCLSHFLLFISVCEFSWVSLHFCALSTVLPAAAFWKCLHW